MAAKYQHTDLLKFRTAIAKGLGDEEMVFWTASEIDTLIEEALLTFGSLSGFWKDNIFIDTEEDKNIYDIFLDSNDLTRIASSITFETLISWLNRDLIENLSTVSPASNYLTLAELINLISNKYNDFQLQTNIILTKTEGINVPPQVNRITLGNNIIDIVRVVFVEDTLEGSPEYILKRADEGELGYSDFASLTEHGQPAYFSTVYGSPNDLMIYPIPRNHGILKIISINGMIANPDEDTIINLPNNLIPYLKFGIEAEIYSKDGLWNDNGKKQYCESRWEEGIMLGKNYNSIVLAKANNINLMIDSLHSVDLYCDYISSEFPPTVLGLAGFNIFGIDTLPDENIHSLGLTTVLNAPIPINDGDFIDVAEEYISILKNYAIHLGQIKCGIAELAMTNSARKALVQIGIAQNFRLQKKAASFIKLADSSKREEIEKPRLVESQA